MNRIKSTLTALLLAGSFQASAANQTILNSSYDIARELFVAYNPVFAEHWQQKQGRRSKLTVARWIIGSSAFYSARPSGRCGDV